jgi:hypothetical protein
MASILGMIYCWALGVQGMLYGIIYSVEDSLLGVVDTAIGAMPAMVSPPDLSGVAQYLWLAGATGLDVCIGIIVGALIVRFTLQTIPFVRWGS